MTLIELAGVVGTLVTLGAGLDLAVKQDLKSRLAALIQGFVGRHSPSVAYRATGVLNSIFGSALFSHTAIRRYAILSLSSTVAAYGFAYFTTPPAGRSDMGWVPSHPDMSSVIVLGFFLIASVLGDIVSYAQTRLFVRAVDTVRSTTVTLGLVAADAVISLTIFLGCFAVARALAYLFIVLTVGVPNLAADKQFIVEAAGLALRDAHAPRTLTGRLSSPTIASSLLTNVSQAQAKSLFTRAVTLRAAHFRADWLPSLASHTDVTCATGQEGSKPLSDTVELLSDAVRSSPGVGTPLSAQAVAADVIHFQVEGLGTKCPYHIATVHIEMPTKAALIIAGPANLFAASVERTLYDAYLSFANKLAPYVPVKPFGDEAYYMQSVLQMTQNTFLGLFTVDAARSDFLNQFRATYDPSQDARLRVPFAPMLASSLLTALFFVCYILVIYGSELWDRVGRLVNLIVPSFDLERATFTSLGLALSLVGLLIQSALFIAVHLWAHLLR